MLDWLIKWILFIIMRMLSWTYKFKTLDFENYERAKKQHPLGSYILVFWHEHLLSPFFFFKGKKICTLVSESRDGKMIGFLSRKFGHDVLQGSQIRDGKDKGGLRALLGMLTKLRTGTPLGVTVDGSIGPRRYVKAGVIDLARKSGAPILPIGATASCYWTLKTWDQFKIPKPFSTIVLYFGHPLEVTKELKQEDIPALQEKIGEILNELEIKAQSYLQEKTP